MAEGQDSVYEIGSTSDPALYCRFLIGRAGEGDVEHALGVMAETGADKKDPELVVLAARAYRDGKGVEKDLGKAIQMMADLHKRGIRTYDLEYVALIYKRNRTSDLGIAAEVLAQLTMGEPEAYAILARAYRDGKGVGKDERKAKQLYEYAIRGDVKWARNELFDILYSSKDEKDNHRAVEIVSVMANKGDRYALLRLGKAYRDGKGVDRDPDLASLYFRQSYEGGSDDAGVELARMLIARSEGSDLEDAFDIVSLLSGKGNRSAMQLLGEMYRDGKGVGKDDAKAQEWFYKVTGQGANRWDRSSPW
ncbi:MAG: sel1 repeat family protein [Candidatus Methanomethylophilaceae archaeon]|nr:sel1 repeat family protein [Candidatus Methanomethylophilaceae archaeon]